MGLKLKWFRRRITFDGVPPAPERDIRRKEATAGTVIGVYRQSTHFEDFIEPVRSSYWEPPPQAIARASKPVSMTNVAAEADSRDKIAPHTPVDRLPQLSADDYEMPPEPNYAAPKPPVRKGVSKAKSLMNLANSLEDANGLEKRQQEVLQQHELRSPQSVEVTTSSNSLPLREDAPSPVKREVSTEPEYIVPLAAEEPFEEPIYDSFEAIFERVKARKPISPASERSNISARPETSSPLPNREPAQTSPQDDGVIFERVKLRNSTPPDSLRSSTTGSLSSASSPSPPPQRKPVLQVTTGASSPPPPTSPPQPKSILKKRAPPPPQIPVEATSSMVEFSNEIVTAIPTPPPRSIRATTLKDAPEPSPPVTPPERKQEPPARPETSMKITNGNDHESDSDSDDDFNWDFVQKHRSSINQTVAAQTQIDPEVLRNAPASLRSGMVQSVAAVPSPRNLPEPIAQPRTLRGMRNQRAHAQLESSGRQQDAPAVQIPPPRARASDSNASETSA
ncbi:AGAP011037-PA [Anopheles gambiae str. PEST]|uniref:AGAP011037-PA n=1 Tax=Anopheles gambiae TaxID=7165 RepID=A7UR44_ANOGA|nr:AGAP011037-PA [Anopheles gambiae str. PEST]